ncbi:unnamed protein product, partial [Polarella glacialis]
MQCFQSFSSSAFLALVLVLVEHAAATSTDMQIYWTQPAAGNIERSELNGSNKETFRSGLNSPYGLAVDMSTGWIYWAAYQKIQRQNLADPNSPIEDWITYASGGLLFPMGVGISHNDLYWADMTSGKVSRRSLDGGPIEDVVTGENMPTCVAVDSDGGVVYWVNYGDGMVKGRSVDLSDSVREVATGLSAPYGVVVDKTNRKLFWSNAISNTIQ